MKGVATNALRKSLQRAIPMDAHPAVASFSTVHRLETLARSVRLLPDERRAQPRPDQHSPTPPRACCDQSSSRSTPSHLELNEMKTKSFAALLGLMALASPVAAQV